MRADEELKPGQEEEEEEEENEFKNEETRKRELNRFVTQWNSSNAKQRPTLTQPPFYLLLLYI